MKKLVFVVIMLSGLFLLTNTLFAEINPEFSKALKYYNSKKYKEAVESLEDYIAKNPDPAAYYLMGYSLYELKRFDEANEYFQEAFLLDPDFSLEKAGLIKKETEEKLKETKKPSGEEAAPAPKPVKPETKQEPITQKQIMAKQETSPAQKAPQPSTLTIPQKPQVVAPAAPAPSMVPAPTKTAPATVSPPAPANVTSAPAPQKVQPPAGMPSFPMPKKTAPVPSIALLTGLLAGFMMIFLVIGVALYVYYALCLFLIAKKLNVAAPWTAWIPILNLWAFVGSAGKPWWWILVFFSPIIGTVLSIINPFVGGILSLIISILVLIVFIYLWMCISENLGKGKLLGFLAGLLFIFTIIGGLVCFGILAFSKSEERTSRMDDITQTQIMED